MRKDEVLSIEHVFCCCAVKVLVLQPPLLLLKNRRLCKKTRSLFCLRKDVITKNLKWPHVVFNNRELHS